MEEFKMDIRNYLAQKAQAKMPASIMDGTKLSMEEITTKYGGNVSIHGFKRIVSKEYGEMTAVDIGGGEWFFATTFLRQLLDELADEYGDDKANEMLKETPVGIHFTLVHGQNKDFYSLSFTD